MNAIGKIGVVGLGAMGAGIAQLCIEAGLETVGREVTEERGEAARARIHHFLTRKVEKGRLGQEDQASALARLTTTTELSDLADCDFVIEDRRGSRAEARARRGARAFLWRR